MGVALDIGTFRWRRLKDDVLGTEHHPGGGLNKVIGVEKALSMCFPLCRGELRGLGMLKST